MNTPTPYPQLGFIGDHSQIKKWQNRLPHWQCKNSSSYFVTFRLADSLPIKLLKIWENQRKEWLDEHPLPWCADTEIEYHRHFSTRIDTLLDAGHGECLLEDSIHANTIEQTLIARDGSHYLLHSWIIMPNHVHVLFALNPEQHLGRVIGAWKRFSATSIHNSTGRSGSLWQRDYFDRIIRDWDHFSNVAHYIRNNPMKAQLADHRYRVWESTWIKRLLSHT